MSKASAIRAGQAYVELFADGTRLEAGLKRAQARLKAFGQSLRQAGTTMALAGGAMLTPFVHAMKTFLEAAKDGKLAGAELGKAISMHQALRSTTAAVEDLEVAIGAALTPTLLRAAEWLKAVVGSLSAWARANPGTVTGIALLAAGVATLGAGLLGLGAAVNIAAWSFGGLSLAATSAFGAISVAAAAVLSPIGLVVAAIGGLGYVLVTQTDAGRESLEYLGQGFNQLKEDGMAAWGGIADAMASGDLGLAAQIGLAAVKLEFQRAWAFIQNLTVSFLVSMNKAFLTAGEWVASTWADTVGVIETALHNVLQTASEVQTVLAGSTASALASAGETVGLLPEGTQNQAELATMQRLQELQRNGDTASDEIAARVAKRSRDIAQQAADMRAELDEGLGAFVGENDAIIANLREQLDSLRNAAADGRKQLEQQMQAKGDAATAAAAAVTARAPKADVFGTFSTAATFGMGIGSTAADRTAKATEESAKELKQIREKIFTGQTATFAP